MTHLLHQERLSQDWAAHQQLLPSLRSHPLPDVPQRPSNRLLEASAVSAATRALLYSKALYAEDLVLWAAVCNRSSLGSNPGRGRRPHDRHARRTPLRERLKRTELAARGSSALYPEVPSRVSRGAPLWTLHP